MHEPGREDYAAQGEGNFQYRCHTVDAQLSLLCGGEAFQRPGELDPTWNHLVGEYPRSNCAKNLHYTLGGPYFSDYSGTDNADDWFDVYRRAIMPLQEHN